MVNGIEYLLTRCVRKPADDHRWGVGWWTLDSEALHNDILQILLSESRAFSMALLSMEGRCHRPSSDFDLVVETDTVSASYIEIKCWSPWGITQKEKQIRLLQHHSYARGFVILVGNSAKESRNQVSISTDHTFTKICYSDLYQALDAVHGEAALCEVAAAYKVGLQQHEDRLRKRYHWNPNE